MKWPIARLGEIATIDRDGVDANSIADGSLFVGLENIATGGKFLNVGRVSKGDLASTKFRFGADHILYGKLRPYLAKIALPDFEGICSTDILPVLPSRRVDRSFLAYFLRQPQMVAHATSRSEGANLPRLSPKALAEFEIPLPPLAEQQRIAAALDQADELRRLRQCSLERLADLEKSIFYKLFGDPIQNSKHWETQRLGEIANIERGKFTPRPRNDPTYYGGSYPFIQTGDISKSGGRLNNWIQTLNEKGKGVSRSFPRDTIVIAIVGATLGMTAILDIEVYCPDSVIGIQVFPAKLTPEYTERLLQIWRPIFISQAPETARANINLESLRPLQIPVPPIRLQRSFSTQLAAIQEIRSACLSGLERLNSLFASLQHRAFNGDLTAKAVERELAEAV